MHRFSKTATEDTDDLGDDDAEDVTEDEDNLGDADVDVAVSNRVALTFLCMDCTLLGESRITKIVSLTSENVALF